METYYHHELLQRMHRSNKKFRKAVRAEEVSLRIALVSKC